MNRAIFLLIAGLWLSPNATHGAQTAQTTLFCWSLRFHQGENSYADSTLDLTGLTGVTNGELVPWYSWYTHRGGFVLDWMGFPISGMLYLDLPAIPDANDNGFDDAYEVSQAASGSADGEYTTALGGGVITATWSREANSKDGTCWLNLVDDDYGDLGTYRHPFEVLEYTGPLAYTPGSNTVTGSVDVTQTGASANEMHGPIQFVKVATNRFNMLTLQPGIWTNAAAQNLVFTNDTLNRDVSWPTNYYGLVVFDDGDLSTGVADYQSWELSIDDPNDSDQDGIPNFTDDPRRPALELTRGTTNLWLVISGDVGFVHRIQETTNALSTNWQTVASMNLTNDPQTVWLPLPSAKVKFWRVLAQ